jgi:hypothetical protein
MIIDSGMTARQHSYLEMLLFTALPLCKHAGERRCREAEEQIDSDPSAPLPLCSSALTEVLHGKSITLQRRRDGLQFRSTW